MTCSGLTAPPTWAVRRKTARTLLAELWPALKAYARFSPFHYFQPTAIGSGMAATWARDVTVLIIASATLSATAFVAFSRRDL